MGFERRLAALEASLSPRNVDNEAKERLSAKLATVAQAHRARRERGGEPVLAGQSMASLLSLILSYPPGSVPHEVARAASLKARALNPKTGAVAAKLVRRSLEIKGWHHGV